MMLGRTLGPAFGVALLPVTRKSLWLPLFGITFEYAMAAHQCAAVAALVLMFAHASRAVVEMQSEGAIICTSRHPTD